MDSGFKNSSTSTTDWLLRWVDTQKKQIHPNEWLREDLTDLERFQKGTIPSNNRSITYLPLMWKILYYSLVSCCPIGTKRNRWSTVHWSAHSQGVGQNKTEKWSYGVYWKHKEIHKNWKVELTEWEKTLDDVKIQRGIFQEDTLSPLLFVIAMMPVNHILRKCTGGYKFTNSQEKELITSCTWSTSNCFQKW